MFKQNQWSKNVVYFWNEEAFLWAVANPGEGPGGSAPSPLFSDQTDSS